MPSLSNVPRRKTSYVASPLSRGWPPASGGSRRRRWPHSTRDRSRIRDRRWRACPTCGSRRSRRGLLHLRPQRRLQAGGETSTALTRGSALALRRCSSTARNRSAGALEQLRDALAALRAGRRRGAAPASSCGRRSAPGRRRIHDCDAPTETAIARASNPNTSRTPRFATATHSLKNRLAFRV